MCRQRRELERRLGTLGACERDPVADRKLLQCADAGWGYGIRYREAMHEVLDRVHPGAGVLFGHSGWSGQQAVGMLWGGDRSSDFWSLRCLVTATISAAASGFSNWSHDVGGYLGRRLVERCSAELLVRWAQFGCFTPLMQAHGRFEQEAWRSDPRTLATARGDTVGPPPTRERDRPPRRRDEGALEAGALLGRA